jgi:hypothetical protein
MQEHSNNTMHYVVALLLGVVGLLIILVFVSIRSQADSTTASASISNQAPTIDSITVASSEGGASLSGASLSLTENVTTTIFVHGQYTDNNGCDEVSDGGDITVRVSSDSVATTSCLLVANTDATNCYVGKENAASSTNLAGNGLFCKVTNCTGGTDVTANYDCRVPIWFYADNTTAGAYATNIWRSSIELEDGGAATNSTRGLNFEVESLNALDTGTAVDYGGLALSGTSAADVSLTLTNSGNKGLMGIALTGGTMTCVDGTIGPAAQRFATQTGVAYADKRLLVTTSADIPNFNIAKRTSTSTAATSNTQWRIQIPPTGLSGACTGTITVTATGTM